MSSTSMFWYVGTGVGCTHCRLEVLVDDILCNGSVPIVAACSRWTPRALMKPTQQDYHAKGQEKPTECVSRPHPSAHHPLLTALPRCRHRLRGSPHQRCRPPNPQPAPWPPAGGPGHMPAPPPQAPCRPCQQHESNLCLRNLSNPDGRADNASSRPAGAIIRLHSSAATPC